jgi:hypothetical protein
MPKPWKILVSVGFVALISFIVYSSMGLGQVTCQVCVEFHGNTSCQPAAAPTRDEAVKTAWNIACSDLASGRTDNIACLNTPPKTTACK